MMSDLCLKKMIDSIHFDEIDLRSGFQIPTAIPFFDFWQLPFDDSCLKNDGHHNLPHKHGYFLRPSLSKHGDPSKID